MRMQARLNFAVLFTILVGVSISVPAVAATSKRIANMQTLYSYLPYPNNQLVFSPGSPVDAVFSPGVQGRIAPLGEGHDLTTVKKYFFGFSVPADPSTVPVIVSGVTFRTITEQPPSVAVEVDVSFSPTPLGQTLGLSPYQLREVGQFTFDKQNRIASFDLSIPYLDTALSYTSPSNPAVVQSMIQGVCSVAQGLCTSSSSGYVDFNDCVSFLSSLPPGSWNRVSSNTVVCRAFHQSFVSIDPTVECPVIGRTGDGQCVDTPYSSYFDETF